MDRPCVLAKWIPTASLVTLVAAVAALAGRGPAAIAHESTSARPAAGAKSVAALGRLEPSGGIVAVGLPSTPDAISGAVVSKIHVQRGADVVAGQLIAEADTVAVLKARLAGTRAELETSRRDARAAASLAEEACVLADVAARQSQRQDELLRRKLTSDDVAEVAKGSAQAGAATCRARQAAAAVAESRIASAEAAVALEEAELERAYVRAPFAGRVLDVLVKPGELAGALGIVELGRVSEMYAIAEVYETDIRHVRVGQKARVKSDALARDLNGTVTRIRPKVQKLDELGTDPAARKDARIVEVEVKLDDPKPAAALSLLQVEVEIGR